MGKRLWGVRLDTASDLMDESIKKQKSKIPPSPRLQRASKNQKYKSKVKNNKSQNNLYGVNSRLVRAVREGMDREGFSYVKIIVSGGFNPERIEHFAKEKVPVDAYGVGSALVHGENDFTADIVMVEGKPIAKVGREYRPNNRLKRFIEE